MSCNTFVRLITSASLLLFAGASRRDYPEFKEAPLLWISLWEMAPNVIVGDVRNPYRPNEQGRGNGPIQRVWFLRNEGDYLRPVVDAGSAFYLRLFPKWENDANVDHQAKFAELLLTPMANDRTLGEFAKGFSNPASVACEILGEMTCSLRIRDLAKLGDPELRGAACNYLESQLLVKCSP